MAGNAAGEGELLEQPAHALDIPADIGIDLTVGALQIGLGYHGISAVSGAREVDHVEIILFNYPVQVGIDKVLPRNSSPVAYDLPLDMLRLQRLPQKGVVQQIELTDRQIVGCPPPCVKIEQFFFI